MIDDFWKEEKEKHDNYFKLKGKCLGYIQKPCISCGRIRVEKYDNGNLICEKCGVDQKTGLIYENKYGNELKID